MKKVILIMSLMATAVSNAQNCSKIFISEYVEGVGNNKAIEIYNPTALPVNLANYALVRYSNGSPTATVKQSVQLSGTIAAYSAFVFVVDLRNPLGTGQTAPIWDSLVPKADAFICPDYAISEAMYFNGDDALALVQASIAGLPLTTDVNSIVPTPVLIDIFGKIGQRPTNLTGGTAMPTGGWSTTAPYAGGAAGGVQLTVDHSLLRKSNIQIGLTNPAIPSFNALADWDSIPALTPRLDANGQPIINPTTGAVVVDGNWASLGVHTCSCAPVAVGLAESKNEEIKLSIYPNPSTNGVFTVEGNNIQSITVHNGLGQVVKSIDVNGEKAVVNLNDKSGVYLATIVFENGTRQTKRLIVR